jgi:glutaredoxin 3
MGAAVTLYVTEYCGFCARAKRLLNEKQVRFTEVNVEGREDLRVWLRKVSGQRTVPQIFINGRSVGGFTDISALDESGELDPLLEEPPEANAPPMPR